MNCTMAWSSSSPPVRIEVSDTMPESAMTAISVVPPPMSITMLPVGVSTGRPDADRRRHRLGHHQHLLGAGGLGRIAHGAALHLGDARRHADDDLRLHPEDVLVDDRLEEVPQHLLGDVEVGDHAVLERPHREDAVGRAAQHPLGLESDALDLAGGLLDRHDRGLVQDDALALHVDEGVGRAEIHRDLVRGEEGPRS